MNSIRATCALSAALLLSQIAGAFPAPPPAVPSILTDPVRRLVQSQISSPSFKRYARRHMGATSRGDQEALSSAVVRFDGPLGSAKIRELEQRGIQFERVKGEVAHVAGFYGVRATPHALSSLLDEPRALRLLPPRPRMIFPSPPPSRFGKVHALTTASDTWPVRDTEGRPLTGEGVTICDLDGAADIFHPMFFRPDAGLYAWLDVNADGTLTPDVDAVDLDHSGAADPGEILRVVGGDITDYYGDVIDPMVGFEAGRAWLYADVNLSGRREHGLDHGFTEADPAYGEPLFLVDDVDHNGQADVGEKLWRLGSSKYKGVLRVASGLSYERGTNLIELPIDPNAGHGTGVGGILAGGEIGLNQVHGVAPAAELLLIDHGMLEEEYDDYDEDRWESTLIGSLAWARGLGANIFVHEYGTCVGEFADGSSAWEQLLDELSTAGAVQTTANHNFAGNQAHAVVTVPAEGTLDIPFDVMDMSIYGYPLYTLQGTLRWRDPDASITATLVFPDGTESPLSLERFEEGHYTATTRDLSLRDTWMLDFYYIKLDAAGTQYETLPGGPYSVRIDNQAPRDVEIHTHITDDSGYSIAVTLGVETTDLGTIAHPATADSAISVGASVGNTRDPGEEELGLKFYSGRGPRIDGEIGVDVVAPDDHYTATPSSAAGEVGHYTAFGGTSGALPQVAGAVALLLQRQPDLTPDEVKELLHTRSGEDSATGALPNIEWGFGRLVTHLLATGQEPVPNDAPTAHIALPVEAIAGEPVVLDASQATDPEDGAPVRFRFDVGYDGHYEVDGEAPQPAVTFQAPGITWIKLEVQDSGGKTSQALSSVEVLPPVTAAAHEVTGCGCGAAATRPAGVLGLLVLAAAWRQRSRRSR